MDGPRFDTVTRSLTDMRSRHGPARLVAGLALGSPLTLLGLRDVVAKKGSKKGKKACDRGKQRCGATCIAKHDCCVGGKRVPHLGTYRL